MQIAWTLVSKTLASIVPTKENTPIQRAADHGGFMSGQMQQHAGAGAQGSAAMMVTHNVLLTNDQAGIVIGRGGSHINEVRKRREVTGCIALQSANLLLVCPLKVVLVVALLLCVFPSDAAICGLRHSHRCLEPRGCIDAQRTHHGHSTADSTGTNDDPQQDPVVCCESAS